MTVCKCGLIDYGDSKERIKHLGMLHATYCGMREVLSPAFRVLIFDDDNGNLLWATRYAGDTRYCCHEMKWETAEFESFETARTWAKNSAKDGLFGTGEVIIVSIHDVFSVGVHEDYHIIKPEN